MKPLEKKIKADIVSVYWEAESMETVWVRFSHRERLPAIKNCLFYVELSQTHGKSQTVISKS